MDEVLSDPVRAMMRLRSSQIVAIQDTKGVGTGVLVGPDGWVLTNKHVAPSIGPYRVVLADGKDMHGVGVHQSAHHDLAIVKIAPSTGSFLDLGAEVTDEHHVGEEVYALGHPRGCRFSVARGIISNPYREIEKEYFIQTDVNINPGNSGGPLVDRAGKLVGIVTMMLSNAQGLGFAVPGHVAADYLRYVRRLVRHGVVKVPEALLQKAEAEQVPAEDIVRQAVNALVEAGKASIEEEKPEEGFFKLKQRSVVVEVRCHEGLFTVSGQLAAVGPSERADARFLTKLLELSGSRDVGGASFSLREGALVAGLMRPTAGLSGLEALWALDLVLHLALEWPTKLHALLFSGGPQAQASADPGYPILTLPTDEAWRRM
ncbi:protease Do [Chondromyces apiculatus DSM 436]|uniref:Protease Do n=2 Tax=Chondromyces apiculatus TaxID=51 RepID=A0A017T6N1_9BACT|nr:protease Do [Chondromyces apiculatus DSM 436]